MENFKPSLGNPARGSGFYPRKREIEKIYGLLEMDANIYLSAPRRVGKTSILKHLEDNNSEGGYFFIYVITESVYSVNDFFEVLYVELVKSKSIQQLAKLSKGLNQVLSTLLNTVGEVGGIKLKDKKDEDYYEKFMGLLTQIEKGIGRIVIMVDEFPQTLHNIHKEKGDNEARRFLQINREIRHDKIAEGKVSFIYTGSISLFPRVEKIASLNDVNDLITLEVKPLTRNEAKDLLKLLCNRKQVAIEPAAIEYMLDEVKWFIPFHLQLIYQELQDIFFEKEDILVIRDVEIAIAKTIDSKNKAMFEPYFSRLEGLLERNEYQFAMEVLKYTANNDIIGKANYFDMAQKYELINYREILEVLCEDGYLYEMNETYTYTSPILQLWCKTNNYGI